MTNVTLSYAGLWARVSAFVFDYLIIALYLILLTTVSLIVNSAFPNITPTLFDTPVTGQITGFLVLTLPVILYFALLESSPWQTTLGKRRKRLKVTGTNGERLTRTRAIGRTVLRFIPWELAHTCIWQVRFAQQETSPIITAGFVLVYILVGANVVRLWISPKHQTLYDWLTGSVVVKD